MCLHLILQELKDTLTWDIADAKSISSSRSSSPYTSKFFHDIKWHIQFTLNNDIQWFGVYLRASFGRRNYTSATVKFMVVDRTGQQRFKMTLTNDFANQQGWGYAQFLTHPIIGSYLVDGTLRLQVDVIYPKIAVELEKTTSKYNLLNDQMKSLYDKIDNEDSDFTIEVEGKTIGAHKVVLRSGWEYFNTMMNGDFVEKQKSRLIIEGHSYATVRQMLQFTYTKNVDFNRCSVKQIIELFKAAHQYNLPALAQQCIGYLKKSATNETIVTLVIFAITLQDQEYDKSLVDELVATCKQWITQQRQHNKFKLNACANYDELKALDKETVVKVFETFIDT